MALLGSGDGRFGVHPQAYGYTIVAFHPRVFQGYRIYLIPWKDHSRENRTNNLYVTCNKGIHNVV
uniref:Uncharacterized protein n=1 Tax=Oryza sativa subsp. japonica TaxID=39947 RepID=Q6K2J9_ORYSJ|nr:hypothetical protein [Oryza sativa Japonica Group]BAD22473.1 hypothetical protein [Oryza sativa Japonica Group]